MQEGFKSLRPRTCKRPLCHAAAAELTSQVMEHAVLAMAKNPTRRRQLQPWNKLNVGVQYHSGFVPLCGALGIVAGGGSLDLGMTGTTYKLTTSQAKKQATKAKLCRIAEAWEKLSPILGAPKTCQEWGACMTECLSILHQEQAPRLNPRNGVYTPAWTLRAYMFMAMREAGLHRLQWGSIGIRAFGAMNADQKGWLRSFESHVKTTAALRQLLGDSCPPELVSCKLCMYSAPELDKYDSDWISACRKYIALLRTLSAAVDGVPAELSPILAEVVQQLYRR